MAKISEALCKLIVCNVSKEHSGLVTSDCSYNTSSNHVTCKASVDSIHEKFFGSRAFLANGFSLTLAFAGFACTVLANLSIDPFCKERHPCSHQQRS